MDDRKISYKVVHKKIEAPGVVTLELSSSLGTPYFYTAGQFIDVYLSDSVNSQGKSYSLSSAPSEGILSITVKAIGQFSQYLYNLEIGDSALGSLPYGFFYSDRDDTHLVLLAGGIGVAPFRSMIVESIVKNPTRKISLFYSSKTEEDIIFTELGDLPAKHPNIVIKNFITREEKVGKGREKGRMKIKQILETLPSLSGIEFLLCGSIAFVRDMRKALREHDVPEELIYTEAFFSH
jgi:uncharacterized protein